jgi:hypothetical protein
MDQYEHTFDTGRNTFLPLDSAAVGAVAQLAGSAGLQNPRSQVRVLAAPYIAQQSRFSRVHLEPGAPRQGR